MSSILWYSVAADGSLAVLVAPIISKIKVLIPKAYALERNCYHDHGGGRTQRYERVRSRPGKVLQTLLFHRNKAMY